MCEEPVLISSLVQVVDEKHESVVVINKIFFFKMIRLKQHMKQKCLTVLVVVSVIMTLKSFLEIRHVAKYSNTLEGRFGYFNENDLGARNKPIIKENYLKSSVIESRTLKTATISPETSSTVSKCGYNVSNKGIFSMFFCR